MIIAHLLGRHTVHGNLRLRGMPIIMSYGFQTALKLSAFAYIYTTIINYYSQVTSIYQIYTVSQSVYCVNNSSADVCSCRKLHHDLDTAIHSLLYLQVCQQGHTVSLFVDKRS